MLRTKLYALNRKWQLFRAGLRKWIGWAGKPSVHPIQQADIRSLWLLLSITRQMWKLASGSAHLCPNGYAGYLRKKQTVRAVYCCPDCLLRGFNGKKI